MTERPLEQRGAPTTSLSGETSSQTMRRVGIASLVGSTIEYYDFLVFGLAAALVFPHVFYPSLGEAAGTVASFATFGVAFVARPLGAVVFGHFGDRIGRKKTLVATLLLMSLATVVVGVMPTAEQIGILAPILVITARILQGFAAGGEYAGAALLSSEYAPPSQRGFWGMAANLGGGIALLLGNLTFLITSLMMSADDFKSFGWRLPFIFSIVLAAVGLYIRLQIEESPVFKEERQAAESSPRPPLIEAVKSQPRELLLAAGMVIVVPTTVYLGASYLANYGTSVLGMSFSSVLAVGVLGGLAVTVGMVLAAIASDRVGRRRVLLTGTILAVVWMLLLFPIMDRGDTTTYGLAVVVTLFISGISAGPMGAYLSELFDTRYRYTAAGFSYNVAQIIGGAVPPIIGVAITAAYGGFTFGLILGIFCLISLACTLGLKETKGKSLHREQT